jgi:hypothetical protein
MEVWVLLGMLVVAELVVLARLPPALARGWVPLNPLGWFGYSELMEVGVEREQAPGIYWLIVVLMAAMAVIFGCVIYVVARGLG